jgi:RNA polymerase-binding protein
MARGSAVRGRRIGSGPTGESERGGDLAARVTVTFWCARGHSTRATFAAAAVPPDTWDCQDCSLPAGQDRDNPPPAPRVEPYKTHLAYVRERRSEADAEVLLAQALARLRAAS